jgi:glutamate racemase
MRILVFDSGLGGLTVHAEIRKVRPDAEFSYLADDAVFPYGRLEPEVLVARVMDIISKEMAAAPADIIVIACNTASTLVLPHLRAAYAVPIVGTVPAVKPAAAMSRSRKISVLATPGTVARDYTRGLIDAFAAHCEVTLVGCRDLASLAEAHLRGERVQDAEIAAEIAPAFVETADGMTDTIVLACTHYPLLLEQLKALAPWPVAWIDPAPAIARRVVQLAGPMAEAAEEARPGRAVFTSGRAPGPALAAALRERYLALV